MEQTNVTDWHWDGESYDPVNIWAGTPPTGDPDRVLTYTIVFRQGTNELLSYQINGTQHLPHEMTGEAELATALSVNIRTDYPLMTTAWPEDFFDVIGACPYSTDCSGEDCCNISGAAHGGVVRTASLLGMVFMWISLSIISNVA